MKNLVIWLFVLVLQIPAVQWANAPESERERARVLAIQTHCEKESERTGCRKFRIWEEIKDGFWNLYIEPWKSEVL